MKGEMEREGLQCCNGLGGERERERERERRIKNSIFKK